MPPNNPFTAADAKSSAAVSRFYGERLLFLPTISGEYTMAASPDPDRESVEFRGTITGEISTQNLSGADRAQSFQGNFQTRDRTVTVEPHALPPGARKGDRIQALEQDGLPVYEMTGEPVNDGTGNRFLIPLVMT